MEYKNKEVVLDEFHMEQFLQMLANIRPVKSKYSSEKMVRMLREGKEQELCEAKMKMFN